MRFQQALKNLIGNAIKFTDKGSVTVEVDASHGEEVPGAGLAVSVTDSGIGIPPEEQPAVFDPYKQAHQTSSRRFGGTGLGLSIARNLIQGLGGDLRLRSTVGVGSTFTIYLPVGDVSGVSTETTSAAPQNTASKSASPSASAPAPTVVQKSTHQAHEDDALLAGKRILLVDDDMRSIYSVTGILEHLQMIVTPAINGQEALDALDRNQKFDLVLMDIAMRGMDGFEATQAIRGQERFRSLPVIALTAHAMKGDRERCLEAGASDYFAKPIVIDDFVAMLRKWLLL
jgi:two-component system chemotaxis sensor kinase CheA